MQVSASCDHRSWPSLMANRAMQSLTEGSPPMAPAHSRCLCDLPCTIMQQGCTKDAASLKYGNIHDVAIMQLKPSSTPNWFLPFYTAQHTFVNFSNSKHHLQSAFNI